MPTQKIQDFWNRTRAELDEVEMNLSMEPVVDADEFTKEGRIKTRDVYRVTMSSFQGTRIRAWYTVPSANPPKGGWPAIMEVPGYSGVITLPSHLPVRLRHPVAVPKGSRRESEGMADRKRHQGGLQHHRPGPLLLPGRVHGLRSRGGLPGQQARD